MKKTILKLAIMAFFAIGGITGVSHSNPILIPSPYDYPFVSEVKVECSIISGGRFSSFECAHMNFSTASPLLSLYTSPAQAETRTHGAA